MQVIGIVTAETERQARAAAKAVEIKYEDLPSIVSIQEALAAGSFFEVSTLICYHAVMSGLGKHQRGQAGAHQTLPDEQHCNNHD